MNNVWQNSGTNECPIHPVALSQSLLTGVLAKPLPALFLIGSVSAFLVSLAKPCRTTN
jgi:hypothetical protein